MIKKILLVHPNFPNSFWTMGHVIHLTPFRYGLPPLGPLTVAALIPEEYDVRFIDMNVRPLIDEDLQWADAVFISAMLVQAKSMAEIVRRARQYGKIIVAGGPYPSSSHDEIKDVDHFIVGEAEGILPIFFNDLKNNRAQKKYVCEEKPDLSLMPPPRYSVVQPNDYGNPTLQFSRGCPFNCEFCDITETFGRRMRTKDPAQFIREFDLVYNAGFRDRAFIVDDNFIGDRQAARQMLLKIIEWQEQRNYPFEIMSQASVNLGKDKEMLDLMVKANFRQLLLGIETPNVEALRDSHKKQNVVIDVYESVMTIQKAGIEVMGGFVVGFDRDTEGIFPIQVDFINKLAVPQAMLGILMALPNTALQKRLKAEGRMRCLSSGDNLDLKPNFVPKMDETALINGYLWALQEIYRPAVYFARCRELIRRLPPLARRPRRPSSQTIKPRLTGQPMATTPLFFVGLRLFRGLCISVDRRHYLSFLGWVLWKKPSRLVTALHLCMRGYHYICIAREMRGKLSAAPEASLKIDQRPA